VDTAIYLHEEVCCTPEYAGTLVEIGRAFKVGTGHVGDIRFPRYFWLPRALARGSYFETSLRKFSTLAAVMLEGADPNLAVI